MKLYPRAGATRRVRAACVEPLENRLLMARLAGIDVSNHQGTGINWTSVKNAGITFAWTKATEGTGFKDGAFTTNMTNAKGKVLIGAYHYARYDLNTGTSGASAEEDYFWNTIKSYYTTANAGKYMVPMLDLENATSSVNPGTAGYTKTTFSQWATRFLNDLKADLASAGFNVTPLIYTGASFGGSWLDATISQSFPVWMANYNGLNHDTSGPDYNGSGTLVYGSPWQTPNGWQFWQYTSSAHVAGVGDGTTTNVDADVFIGDIYDLTSNYVIGGAPRWDADERIVTTTSVSAWATGAANTTSTSVASGVYGKVLSPTPVYGNSFWRWHVQFDNGVTGWVGEDFMDSAAPSLATTPGPANTAAYVTALPASFTWSAAANATAYNVYLDGVLKATVTTNSWTHPAIADGAHTWRVDSVNAERTATGTTWSFAVDTVAPSATYLAATATTRGATTYDFTVTYSDATSGVLYASLAAGDVLVTGPNGFSQLAALVSVDTADNGTPRTVTYRVTAPGGAWDAGDNGTYTLSQVATTVRDVAGNYRPGGAIGTFAAAVPFAYAAAGVLVVDFYGAAPVTLSRNGGNLVATQGSAAYTFASAGLTEILVNATGGAGTLNVAGNLSRPITFAAGGVPESLNFTAGSSGTVAGDAAGSAVAVAGGALVTFAATQHLGSLAIAGGSVILPAGAGITLSTGGLSITDEGGVDLNDNPLIWDYTGASPADTLRGYLFAGRNGGSWDGAGVASTSAAGDPHHAMGLGYLEASALGVTSFGGVDVDATALLVKYTPAGDANLNGKIDPDDYALTDRGFARNVTDPAWVNGDYDYDGLLTAGDYLRLDTSAGVQAGTLSPADLGNLEAAFGPAYVEALMAAVAAAPAPAVPAFSETPIVTADAPAVVTKAVRLKAPAAEGAAADVPAVRPAYTAAWAGDAGTDKKINSWFAFEIL